MPNENLSIAIEQILTEWLKDLNDQDADLGVSLLSLWQRLGYCHDTESASSAKEEYGAIKRFAGVLGRCFIMLHEGKPVQEVLASMREGIKILNIFQLEELPQILACLADSSVQNRMKVLGRKWFHKELCGKINNFVIRALLENSGINPDTKVELIEQLRSLTVSPDWCEKNAEAVDNILQQVIYGELKVDVKSITGVEKRIDGSSGADIGALSELGNFPDAVKAAVRFREILLYAVITQDKYKPTTDFDLSMADAIRLSERETKTQKLEALLRLVEMAPVSNSIDRIVARTTQSMLRQRYYRALLTQYLTLERLSTVARANIILAQKFFNRPKNELERELGMGSNAEGEFSDLYGKLWKKFGLSVVAESVQLAPIAESSDEKAGREMLANLNQLIENNQITFAALQAAHCFFYPEDYGDQNEAKNFAGDILDDFNLVTARCYIALLNKPSEGVLVTREQLEGMGDFFHAQASQLDSSEVDSFNAAVAQRYSILDSVQTGAAAQENLRSELPAEGDNLSKVKKLVDTTKVDSDGITDEEEDRFFEELSVKQVADATAAWSNIDLVSECDWLNNAIYYLAKLKMLLGEKDQAECLGTEGVKTVTEAKNFFATTKEAMREDFSAKDFDGERKDIRSIIEAFESKFHLATSIGEFGEKSAVVVPEAPTPLVAELPRESVSVATAPHAALFPPAPASKLPTLTEEMAALLRGSTPSFPMAEIEVAKTPQEKMRARVSQILGDKLEIFIKKEFQEWLDRGYVTRSALEVVGIPRKLITGYGISKSDAGQVVAQAKEIISKLKPLGTPEPIKIRDKNLYFGSTTLR